MAAAPAAAPPRGDQLDEKRDPEKLEQFQDLLQKAKGSGMLGRLDPAFVKQAEDKLQELRSEAPVGPPGTKIASMDCGCWRRISTPMVP